MTRVDVRWALTDDVSDPGIRAAYEATLTPEERARQNAYMRDENKREFLLGRRLARQSLSLRARSLGVDAAPEVWRLVADDHGCLRVAAPEALARLRFNISHGTGMVVCAVAEGIDVGIDVEPLDRPVEAMEIADRFFSEREVADLTALPLQRRQARFLEYWTLKEAYIKARGLGLALPLAGFSFLLAEGHSPVVAPATLLLPHAIGIEFAPEVPDDPARWHFLQFRLSSRHLVALGVASGAASPEVHVVRA
jgi:4'-phosphopantetheinyl transferase